MLLSFDTHDVYVIYKEDKVYKLKEDFSKEEVDRVPYPSGGKRPIIVINKGQFDCAKSLLLDKQSALRMSEKTAKVYNKLGFLTDEELNKYLNE